MRSIQRAENCDEATQAINIFSCGYTVVARMRQTAHTHQPAIQPASIPALCALKTSAVFGSANMRYCLFKHDNTHFPAKYNTVFRPGKNGCLFCTFGHIAPYVSYFTSLAQISAGNVQPGNPRCLYCQCENKAEQEV